MAKSTGTTVTFNKEVLSLISELTSINTAIKIVKTEEGRLLIKSQNPSLSIAYILETEASSFNFIGDELAFYDYSSFFSWVTSLNITSITQTDEVMLTLGAGKNKVVYQSSDPDIIKGTRFAVEFEDPDATFVLNSVDLKELLKVIGLLKSSKDFNTIKLTFDGDKVAAKLYNGDTSNTFETEFPLSFPVSEEFSIRISDEVLRVIPQKYNYVFEVKQEGLVKISLKNELGVDVALYIGEVEED